MENKVLSAAQQAEFHRAGYVIVRGFFTPEETDKLYRAALEDEVMRKHALDQNDQSGKKTRLSLWYTPGDDIYGQRTRSGRLERSSASVQRSEATGCRFHTELAPQ